MRAACLGTVAGRSREAGEDTLLFVSGHQDIQKTLLLFSKLLLAILILLLFCISIFKK